MEIIKELEIEVCDGVYEPSEDSILLLELIEVEDEEKVLEIGCGSGMISLHCARVGCEVTAVDISKKATKNTLRNSLRNRLDIDVKVSDLFSDLSGRWDTIIFNPPYLPEVRELDSDPRWDGGKNGDETILEFLSKADKYLEENGHIYFIYSDRGTLHNICQLIEEKYTLLEQRSETFRFETIFAAKLQFETNET